METQINNANASPEGLIILSVEPYITSPKGLSVLSGMTRLINHAYDARLKSGLRDLINKSCMMTSWNSCLRVPNTFPEEIIVLSTRLHVTSPKGLRLHRLTKLSPKGFSVS